MLPHSVIDNDLTDIYLNENLRDYDFKLKIQLRLTETESLVFEVSCHDVLTCW